MSKSQLLRRLILLRVIIGTGILVSSCTPRAISPPVRGLAADSPAVLSGAVEVTFDTLGAPVTEAPDEVAAPTTGGA